MSIHTPFLNLQSNEATLTGFHISKELNIKTDILNVPKFAYAKLEAGCKVYIDAKQINIIDLNSLNPSMRNAALRIQECVQAKNIFYCQIGNNGELIPLDPKSKSSSNTSSPFPDMNRFRTSSPFAIKEALERRCSETDLKTMLNKEKISFFMGEIELAITKEYSNEIIELLLQKGAKIEFNTLQIALKDLRCDEIIELLLDKGAKINKRELIDLLPSIRRLSKQSICKLVDSLHLQTDKVIKSFISRDSAPPEFIKLLYQAGYPVPNTLLKDLMFHKPNLEMVDALLNCGAKTTMETIAQAQFWNVDSKVIELPMRNLLEAK